MSRSRDNLFLTLAEHLSRKDENYLTQTLAAVFDASPSFRSEFVGLLSRGLRGLGAVNLDQVRLRTQKGFTSKNGRTIFDAELVEDPREANRLAVIEVKLDSPEGPGQFGRYRKALRRKVPLVLLVKHADEGVSEADLMLSWTSVYLIAQEAAAGLARNGFERNLLGAWMEFLSAKGIVSPDPIPRASWGRVRAFAQVMAGEKKGHLNHPARTLDEMRSILARLELHRDDMMKEKGWKQSGWKPYSLVWRDGAFCSVVAGYWDPKKKKYANQLEIELHPGPPKLIVSRARGDWDAAPEHRLKCDVIKIFSRPFDEARSHLQRMLKGIPFSKVRG